MTVDADTYRVVLLGIEQYLDDLIRDANALRDLIHKATTDKWADDE